jgi:hypothetical protein
MSVECVERRFCGKPCVTSMRTCGLHSDGMRTSVLSQTHITIECARRGWYSWVANRWEEVVFVRASLFLDRTAENRIGGLVQFACCWRSWPSLDRGLVCRDPSSFQGSTVGSVCRPTSLVLHILRLPLQHRAFLPSLHTFASS